MRLKEFIVLYISLRSCSDIFAHLVLGGVALRGSDMASGIGVLGVFGGA